MQIHKNRRYFKLCPDAAKVVKEWELDVKRFARSAFDAIASFLVELGVPEDEAEGIIVLRLIGESYDLGFKEDAYKHLPKVFVKPKKGLTRFRANFKRAAEIEKKVDELAPEHLNQRLPTLKYGHMSFNKNYTQALTARTQSIGEDVYFTGIFKSDRDYTHDPEIMTELSLSEWAAVVEAEESKKTYIASYEVTLTFNAHVVVPNKGADVRDAEFITSAIWDVLGSNLADLEAKGVGALDPLRKQIKHLKTVEKKK